jgi:hypothetical protein
MTAISLEEFAKQLELQLEDPEERFLTSGVDWLQYSALLYRLPIWKEP